MVLVTIWADCVDIFGALATYKDVVLTGRIIMSSCQFCNFLALQSSYKKTYSRLIIQV